ncbi:MAG: hypothetical protein LBI95_02835 [Holosporales bacterium]|jgi:tyrosine-specific transport protein|nr:hypothetical protein [Holosporales bacterium]
MSKLPSAVFLISGTAIGAGLVALPLAAANIGIFATLLITIFSLFVAYQTSMITVNLIEKAGEYLTIVELSKKFSGQLVFGLSMASFYLLSFSLLSVYFVGTSDIINYFTNLDTAFSVAVCSLIFLVLFSLRFKSFYEINSALFIVLIISILLVIFNTCKLDQIASLPDTKLRFQNIFYFLPIVFTSFGVQNICSCICQRLEMDIKQIRKAFLIGISIPAIIYVLWIYTVLQSIYSIDQLFFEKILDHKVGAGELVNKLCEASGSSLTEIFFKILTLFAIITSAIGIGVGIISSLKANVSRGIDKLIPCIVVAIPTIASLLIPNAFMSILSFGGIIATVFVVFTPFYLLFGIDRRESVKLKYLVCVLYAIAVVLSELFL